MIFCSILSWLGFGSLCISILLSPWFFGAWETWWFWPFVVVQAVSVMALALRLLWVALGRADTDIESGMHSVRILWGLLLSYVLFLVYAVARTIQVDVYTDAERNLLLFVTAFLMAFQIIVGLSSRQVRWLLWGVFANLCLLALYGLANHAVTGSRLVLWEAGYAQYAGRASGSYFCPDHYAGVCELLAALCLGLAFARETRMWQRVLAGAFLLVAATGVVLSQSRGGGLTLVVLAAAIFVCGMLQWPLAVRWYSRGAMACAVALAVLISAPLTKPYVQRFCSYVDAGHGGQCVRERYDQFKVSLLETPRGRMISAALRSWRTAPLLGIGPGMHQNLWPHIAPTADGDRALNRWPSQTNHHFHSYEVHSDWVQLLQEHGLVGFALFLGACGIGLRVLLRGIRLEMDQCARAHWVQADNPNYGALLGGFLALLAMAFHSLGDFNLQMPATTWILAAILAVAWRAAIWTEVKRG